MDALLKEQRPWPTGGGLIPQSERYQFLVQVTWLAKGMQKAMDQGDSGVKEKLQAAGLKPPDWNRIMRLGNRVFDMVQADETRMSAQERAEHRRAVTTRISEMEVIRRASKSDMRADGTMDETWLLPQAGETQDAYSDRVGTVVVMMMSPDPERSRRFFDACNERTAWTRVAVALLRYRQDRGAFPEDTKSLIPKYIAAMPEANANWPMRYEKTAKGFGLTNDSGATTREGAKMQTITIRRER